jgi:galactokinase
MSQTTLDTLFDEHFPAQDSEAAPFTVVAPGRVNLIGEHIDYNDGLVLPMALSLSTRLKLRARNDRTVRLYAANFGTFAEFSLDALEKQDEWIDYVAGVAEQLQQSGLALGGFEGVVESNVPAASGLSSSAALEVGAAHAFLHVAEQSMEPLPLARLCQKAENEFVGVNCGIMDQAAVAACTRGHALLLDCRDLSTRHIPFHLEKYDPGYCIVVIDSSAPRELASSAYNERRAQCEAGLETLAKYLPGLTSLRDVSPADLEKFGGHLEPTVLKRVRHVVGEIARVQEAVAALEASDLHKFGALMNASHDSLRDDYEVSSRELDTLVDECRAFPGVLGSRMTGAGFGGCTVTLMERAQAVHLALALPPKYLEATGREAKVYVCAPEAGAHVVEA